MESAEAEAGSAGFGEVKMAIDGVVQGEQAKRRRGWAFGNRRNHLTVNPNEPCMTPTDEGRADWRRPGGYLER